MWMECVIVVATAHRLMNIQKTSVRWLNWSISQCLLSFLIYIRNFTEHFLNASNTSNQPLDKNLLATG